MARHCAACAAGDQAVQRDLAVLSNEIDVFEALQLKIETQPPQLRGKKSSSLMKLRATELHQAITELGIRAAPHERLAQEKYFSTRAATIYSGTSEIHRNSLAWAIGCP